MLDNEVVPIRFGRISENTIDSSIQTFTYNKNLTIITSLMLFIWLHGPDDAFARVKMCQ